jgi:uncharacterized protein (DUF1778 family)
MRKSAAESGTSFADTKRQKIRLNRADTARFLALLENPPEPTEALRRWINDRTTPARKRKQKS